ncbi:MAG TPA: phosphatase PAP2 family protein [Mycobacteriales bacterium]|jgi:membrane-associated phospholipid phosphatase|nr:phosphatase PAP2 family protein [Mycobacteriales bacterium]
MVTASATAAQTTIGVDRVAVSQRLLIAAAFSAGLAAVTYLLMVRTVLGQRFDNAALLGSLEQDPSSRVHDIFFLERINAASFAAVLLIIVALGFARRRRVLGVSVAVAALVSVNGTDLLKDGVLTRPFLVADDALRRANSFPSGHTATAISCALALVVLSPPAIRGLVAILAGSYSWIVAADVQTAGWHRPSDAIGATLICFAVICVVAALLVRRRPTGSGLRLTHVPAFAVLIVVWGVSMTLAALNSVRVLRFLAHTSEPVQLTHALLNESYQFSVNLTVAIVVTALIILLLLLGPYDLDEPATRATPAPSIDSAR